MKELDKKLIIDNGFWRVFQTLFETKNGKTGNVITMDKSKNKNGILVFPITKDKEILYIKEFKFGPSQEQFVFPAGGIIDDDLEKSVKKELLEETGYETNKIINMGFYNHNAYISGKEYIFLALECQKVGNQNLHDIEEIEVFKINFELFEKMIKNNEINCPWSELAFRKAKELTNNFTNFNI